MSIIDWDGDGWLTLEEMDRLDRLAELKDYVNQGFTVCYKGLGGVSVCMYGKDDSTVYVTEQRPDEDKPSFGFKGIFPDQELHPHQDIVIPRANGNGSVRVSPPLSELVLV